MEGGFFFSNFALFADAVKTQNEWWRLPSAALADFGLEHVLATNVSLWLIGREIETLLGTTSFLAVYFLGATGGAIATLAFDDSSKLIAGSSGAVFALYGAILTYTVLNLESGWNQRGFTTRLFRIGASSIAHSLRNRLRRRHPRRQQLGSSRRFPLRHLARLLRSVPVILLHPVQTGRGENPSAATEFGR